MDLPEFLVPIQLLEDVRGICTTTSPFDFQVEQNEKRLMVLNMSGCCVMLEEVCNRLGDGAAQPRNLCHFIDQMGSLNMMQRIWHDCIRDCNPTGSQLALLTQLGSMPSRATYSYILKADDRCLEQLPPESPVTLKAVSILAAMIRRCLEVEALGKLEKTLNADAPMAASRLVPFLNDVARYMNSLRWKKAWLDEFCAGPEVDGCRDRLMRLTHSLYFHYTATRDKVGWAEAGGIGSYELHGEFMKYEDTERAVWDGFPGEATVGGYEEWLSRGPGLLEEAGVHERMEALGLSSGVWSLD